MFGHFCPKPTANHYRPISQVRPSTVTRACGKDTHVARLLLNAHACGKGTRLTRAPAAPQVLELVARAGPRRPGDVDDVAAVRQAEGRRDPRLAHGATDAAPPVVLRALHGLAGWGAGRGRRAGDAPTTRPNDA